VTNKSHNSVVFFSCAQLPEVDPLKPEDIELALRNTRPSAHLDAHRYEKFNQDYGSQVLCSEHK
jgi:katanin p60 ATPase-containing subunit A1